MKKTLCILFLGCCTVVNTYAQTLASVTSPDGSIVLQINGKDNNLSYNVKKGGNTVLVEAPISMTIDQTEICCGISVLSSDTYKTVCSSGILTWFLLPGSIIRKAIPSL